MSTKIRAIAVDDEERALNSLSTLLAMNCPEITLVGTCRSVPEAVLLINKEKPDVVFLDIEMPEYNGFELLGFFRNIDFQIVFVTAYSEYAVKAFEVSAADYLLKPVDIEALQNAVEKIKSQLTQKDLAERFELLKQSYKGEPLSKIAVPMNDGLHFIPVPEIIYLEADGAYTTLYKRDGSKIVVSKKLKFFESALDQVTFFFRPHRSFMLNLHAVKHYNKGTSEILLDTNQRLQVARDRKTEFEEALKKFHLSV